MKGRAYGDKACKYGAGLCVHAAPTWRLRWAHSALFQDFLPIGGPSFQAPLEGGFYAHARGAEGAPGGGRSESAFPSTADVIEGPVKPPLLAKNGPNENISNRGYV